VRPSNKVKAVHVGQVYLEKGYNRHFKIRSIEGEKAVVSTCMGDGSEFQGGGHATRIRLDRLVRSPYVLTYDPKVRTCPTCGGSGAVQEEL